MPTIHFPSKRDFPVSARNAAGYLTNPFTTLK
jgi:hypothetical protein